MNARPAKSQRTGAQLTRAQLTRAQLTKARGAALRVGGLATAVGAMAGIPVRPKGGVVLGYHDIQPLDQITTDYTVTPQRLREQLVSARRVGLSFVTLESLGEKLLSGQDVSGLAAVVFDDALVGVHHYGLEVLADLGVPATMFPLTINLGVAPSWWPGAARTMTNAELGDLVKAGWGIGSHTRTHSSLPSLDAGKLRTEVVDSKAELEDAWGVKISTIAYPFGHHNEQVRDQCRAAGYTLGYTFLNGRVSDDLDRFKLPRLTMTMRSHGLRWAYQLVRPAASWPDCQLDTVSGGDSL